MPVWKIIIERTERWEGYLAADTEAEALDLAARAGLQDGYSRRPDEFRWAAEQIAGGEDDRGKGEGDPGPQG